MTSEVKEFKVTLISEMLSISVGNLFGALNNTIQLELNKKAHVRIPLKLTP